MQTGMDGGRVSILYTFKSDQTITTIYLVIVTGLRMFSALGACWSYGVNFNIKFPSLFGSNLPICEELNKRIEKRSWGRGGNDRFVSFPLCKLWPFSQSSWSFAHHRVLSASQARRSPQVRSIRPLSETFAVS